MGDCPSGEMSSLEVVLVENCPSGDLFNHRPVTYMHVGIVVLYLAVSICLNVYIVSVS